MKRIFFIPVIIVTLLFVSCGDPQIEITSTEYAPKIVVEGYVYPGEPVRDIKIMRNFPLNKSIDSLSFYITNAVVSINDVPLSFDPYSFSYYTNSLTIVNGNSYTIKVSAVIDGKQLTTSATTFVPAAGFNVLNKNLGVLKYGQDNVWLKFNPSSSTDFYAVSIRPDSASLDNFIYENTFLPNIKREDLEKNITSYKLQYELLIDVLKDPTITIEYKIQPFSTWFYSSYKMVVYAGDYNFRQYLLTARDVQEGDGNFHEPRNVLSGDGIGVFGSAIRDTVSFTLVK